MTMLIKGLAVGGLGFCQNSKVLSVACSAFAVADIVDGMLYGMSGLWPFLLLLIVKGLPPGNAYLQTRRTASNRNNQKWPLIVITNKRPLTPKSSLQPVIINIIFFITVNHKKFALTRAKDVPPSNGKQGFHSALQTRPDTSSAGS